VCAFKICSLSLPGNGKIWTTHAALPIFLTNQTLSRARMSLKCFKIWHFCTVNNSIGALLCCQILSKVKSVSCVPLYWLSTLNYKSITGHGPSFINNVKWTRVCQAHVLMCDGNRKCLILTNAACVCVCVCESVVDKSEGEQWERAQLFM